MIMIRTLLFSALVGRVVAEGDRTVTYRAFSGPNYFMDVINMTNTTVAPYPFIINDTSTTVAWEGIDTSTAGPATTVAATTVAATATTAAGTQTGNGTTGNATTAAATDGEVTVNVESKTEFAVTFPSGTCGQDDKIASAICATSVAFGAALESHKALIDDAATAPTVCTATVTVDCIACTPSSGVLSGGGTVASEHVENTCVFAPAAARRQLSENSRRLTTTIDATSEVTAVRPAAAKADMEAKVTAFQAVEATTLAARMTTSFQAKSTALIAQVAAGSGSWMTALGTKADRAPTTAAAALGALNMTTATVAMPNKPAVGAVADQTPAAGTSNAVAAAVSGLAMFGALLF